MPHNRTVYMDDEEFDHVDERTDDDDPNKPSFSGYIRGLIRDDMGESGAA